jgi:glycosyltransferase involved in cell wall biosynthesis
MEKITLSIFVPCFNEEKNIIKTLDNINEAIQNINYEILIADDGSKDKTVEFVEKFKKQNPNLNIRIFTNESNKGLGFNYYATAYKALGTYYLQLMGDASEPPNTIKKMLDNLGKAEIVMAYFPGKNDKRSLLRRIISKTFVILLNIINFNNLKRYNGPAIHLLENVKMYGSGADGHGNHAELISILMTHKKKFIEVEVENTIREEGSTKAFELKNLLSVSKSLITIFLIRINYILKKIKIFKN